MNALLKWLPRVARAGLREAGTGWLRPPEGWSTLLLTALVVGASGQAVTVSGWGAYDELLPRLSLLGAGAGLLAARSLLRAGWAWLLSLVVGVEWTLVSYALTAPGRDWTERLNSFSALVWAWIGAAPRDGPGYDPLIVDLVLGFTLFLFGYGVSWLVFRRGAGWWALTLIAAVGVVHLSYATVDSFGPFLWSLLLGVLLVANLGIHRRRAAWQAIGVPVQAGALGWTLLSATMLASLALFLATRLPSDAVDPGLAARYQQLSVRWDDLQREIDRMVGGTRGQARPGTGLAFSETLLPREDFDLGAQPVLRIHSPQRLYWRTVTYDRYDGRSLQSTVMGQQRYDSGALLPNDPSGGLLRSPVEIRVDVLAPSASALFNADSPVAFSVPTTIDQRQVSWDLAGVRATTALQRGESYTAQALIGRAGLRELVQAGNRFPDWTRPYLELPASLPPRVGALANQITLGTLTPLDRVLAIEAYLRGLTYSTHAVVPGVDRDWVDFLLFDSESGYCDYFATAMMVLLRTQGIPARVASGFAPGELEGGRSWLVRESDAHSWVEVYFPNYGWQVFEPSASRGRPERPESPLAGARSISGASRGQEPLEPPTDLALDHGGTGAAPPLAGVANDLAAPLVWLAVTALGVGGLLWSIVFAWELGLSAERPAKRRYGQLRRCLAWGGWPVAAAMTPVELGAELARAWPDQAVPLMQLVACYSTVTYGRPTLELDRSAETAWEMLRGPLVRRLVARRLRQAAARFRSRDS